MTRVRRRRLAMVAMLLDAPLVLARWAWAGGAFVPRLGL